jgi:O-antigen/teichoic acid export membrane protein
MRVRDRLLRGTALNLVATIFNQGSTFIVNIFLARILAQQGFGEYAMVQSTLLTISILSQVAIGNTVLKYTAELRHSDPQRAGRIMGLCGSVSIIMAGVGTLLLLVLAPWLASHVLKVENLITPLMMGAGYLFFSTISGYQTGVLSGLEAYRSLAIAGVVNGIVYTIVISLGAWWGGLNGAFTGLSISALVFFTIQGRLLCLENRVHGIKPQYRSNVMSEKVMILNFILPIAIAQFYSPPMIWLAKSFLVSQPGGYKEMALYSAASNLQSLVLFLPGVIQNVGLAILNNEAAKGNITQQQRVFRYNVLYIFLISLGVSLVIGFFGRPILLLFGKSFETGKTILWILLISGVFQALTAALYQYVLTKSKLWHQFIGIVVPREAFLVAMTYYLVGYYGGFGMAVAYLGSAILGLVLHLILIAILYKQESYNYSLKIDNMGR